MTTTYTLAGCGTEIARDPETLGAIRDENGRYVQRVVDDVTFKSGMEMLHWAVKSRLIGRLGHGPRTAATVYLGNPRDEYRAQRCVDAFPSRKVSTEAWNAMKRAQDRLQGLLHYLREVEPEWQDEGRIHYMDNSVVMAQRNKYGQRREVTLIQPHGDACF
ncbi:hypothetical protein F7Q99_36150 [Streptomyces kaniharaensis]|uniref:Uncharacterized protein n=1 Tax=Streptomyces kaniharaensis TaxID=212423 RepID=A0A6N7L2Q2_9ACTN|nr:hypothetical protein [Streptomyces kaniharaensis]MQS17475.1 hypothetical protein [Streptomyces kaniharaensis]